MGLLPASVHTRSQPTFTAMRIIKVGGRVVEDTSARARLIDTLASLTEPLVLVHGGGNMTSDFTRQLGREPRMVEGRRVTDAADLQLAVMVYAGWLNKTLVADLHAAGRAAVGLSGADGDLLRARRRLPVADGVDFGFVGDVESVNTQWLLQLLTLGLTPVVCAVTHDGAGQLLNTNADTIATSVARAMAEVERTVEFYSCLDQPGVMRDIADPESRIEVLAEAEYRQMKSTGQIHSGMIPKLDTGFGLLAAGVRVRLGDVDGINSGGTTLALA